MSPSISGMCNTCGRGVVLGTSTRGTIPGQAGMLRLKRYSNAHTGLVRSVCMNEEWVVSGSYDSIVKIWNRKTGAFIGDLTGGHTGRVFGVGFDCTKVVSVGEDQVRDLYYLADVRDTQRNTLAHLPLGFRTWHRHLIHQIMISHYIACRKDRHTSCTLFFSGLTSGRFRYLSCRTVIVIQYNSCNHSMYFLIHLKGTSRMSLCGRRWRAMFRNFSHNDGFKRMASLHGSLRLLTEMRS